MDFISEHNPCGYQLLQLTATGDAVIAELTRLAQNLPSIFYLKTKEDQKRYANIIFDFQYLDNSTVLDYKIRQDSELYDLDQELKTTYKNIAERLYNLFKSIYLHFQRLSSFFDSVINQHFYNYPLEKILEDKLGSQLISEALYQYGLMMILLDRDIPGIVRERCVVFFYRLNSSSDIPFFEEVVKLVSRTGYSHPDPYPKNYPFSFIERYPLDKQIVRTVLGKLRSEDIYQRSVAFPDPDHRSTALSKQAAMIYIILFFVPEVLEQDNAIMREIVDKFFADNWIVSFGLGHTADISVVWKPFRAARGALDDMMSSAALSNLGLRYDRVYSEAMQGLSDLLVDGVLTREYLLSNLTSTLNTIRVANVTLRFLMLHSVIEKRKTRERVMRSITEDSILDLLLQLSDVEFQTNKIINNIIDNKESAWEELKSVAKKRLQQLAAFYSGQSSFAEISENKRIHDWFTSLITKVDELSLDESVVTSRLSTDIIMALERVEMFEEVQKSIIQQLLEDLRAGLTSMLKLLNIGPDVVFKLSLITDFSHSWHLIRKFVPLMHQRIRQDAGVIMQLRGTFLKLASLLEGPLLRMTQFEHSDLESVASFFSNEIVKFVSDVLQIVPHSMFKYLHAISALLTDELAEIPSKISRFELIEFAKVELRERLNVYTNQVCVLARGILAMQRNFIGVIEIDPKEMLEAGLRRELIKLIADTVHTHLVFNTKATHGPETLVERFSTVKKELLAIKTSMQYIQDYVNIEGLRLYNEEFERLVIYNVEESAFVFMKKATQFQPNVVFDDFDVNPVPSFEPIDKNGVNWMARLANELIRLVSHRHSFYCPKHIAFVHCEDKSKEFLSIRIMRLLFDSLGVAGFVGLNKYLSFLIVSSLQKIYAIIEKYQDAGAKESLTMIDRSFYPLSSIVSLRNFTGLSRIIDKYYDKIVSLFGFIGRAQLIQNMVSYLLKHDASINRTHFYGAMVTINEAIIEDVKEHYRNPLIDDYVESSLLSELCAGLNRCGISDSDNQVYSLPPLFNFVPLTCLAFVFKSIDMMRFTEMGDLKWYKSQNHFDETSLCIALHTFLQQFHPHNRERFIGLLGQYIRSYVADEWSFSNALSTKTLDVNDRVKKVMRLLSVLKKNNFIPNEYFKSLVPEYLAAIV
ncbi:hypothetical protein PCE1_003904 [Barthelona sp. PCE]